MRSERRARGKYFNFVWELGFWPSWSRDWGGFGGEWKNWEHKVSGKKL